MMINPQTILIRTQAGSELLQTAGSDLSRTERLLLIMVNGQVSVGDISGKLYSIPLRRLIEALDYLSGRGLISQDHSNRPTPTALKRHELEAFLRTDELDPTTAMIANFELQAALNDSAHASIITNEQKTQNESELEAKILTKLRSSTPLNQVLEQKAAKQPLPTILSSPKKTTNQHTSAQKPQTKKHVRRKKQSNLPFLYLALFGLLWFAVIWYIRHK
jgi:hypothetical protein